MEKLIKFLSRKCIIYLKSIIIKSIIIRKVDIIIIQTYNNYL